MFTYVKTCERGRVKVFEQQSRVYYAVFFTVDPDDRVIMELQCISFVVTLINKIFFEVKILFEIGNTCRDYIVMYLY